MRSSVVLKLSLMIVALAGSMLLVLAVLVPQQMTGLYDFHLSDHMLGQARGLIQLYEPDPEMPGDRPWLDLEGVIGAHIVTLTTAQVATLSQAPVGSPALLPPDRAQRLLDGQDVTYRVLNTALDGLDTDEHNHGIAPERPYWLFAVGVPVIKDGVNRGALLVIQPTSPVDEALAESRQTFLWVAAGMLLLVTLLALYLSSRMSLPLRRMNAMAQAMAGGDFQQRLAVTGTDEIAWLGHSINRLADALDETIAQLHENNARLSGILTSMNDAVMLVDGAGGCTLMNQPAADLLRAAGIPCEEAPCTIHTDLLTALGVGDEAEQVLRNGLPLERKVSLSGSAYSVSLSAVVDQRTGGQGAVLVWQDITESERLEEMRRDFVANVSHEMRTPIGVVRGYTEALQDGLAESQEEHEEMLAIMQEELDRVEQLITDLLQLARIDAGQIRMDLEPLAPGPLMQHMARKLAPLCDETGSRITVSLPPELPLVLADGDRVEQVLVNLVENALRYSPRGSEVTLRARAEADHLVIVVQDQGPGIPPEERPLVWERFYRSDKAHSRKKGGTGLGLAIVRGIVAAHGGQVWVDDAPGGGSLFCFTLPLVRQ